MKYAKKFYIKCTGKQAESVAELVDYFPQLQKIADEFIKSLL